MVETRTYLYMYILANKSMGKVNWWKTLMELLNIFADVSLNQNLLKLDLKEM